MVYDDKLLFDRQLNTLNGKRWELIIREERVPANSGQKSFYVGIVLKEAHRHEAFVHYNSPKAIHDAVMAKLFLTEYVVVGGKLTTKTKGLAELNEQEMWDLTERVIAYLLTEHQIVISEAKNYHIKE